MVEAIALSPPVFYVSKKAEDEKYLTALIKNCHTIMIEKSTIEEYLKKDYIELNGMKMDCPTE